VSGGGSGGGGGGGGGGERKSDKDDVSPQGLLKNQIMSELPSTTNGRARLSALLKAMGTDESLSRMWNPSASRIKTYQELHYVLGELRVKTIMKNCLNRKAVSIPSHEEGVVSFKSLEQACLEILKTVHVLSKRRVDRKEFRACLLPVFRRAFCTWWEERLLLGDETVVLNDVEMEEIERCLVEQNVHPDVLLSKRSPRDWCSRRHQIRAVLEAQRAIVLGGRLVDLDCWRGFSLGSRVIIEYHREKCPQLGGVMVLFEVYTNPFTCERRRVPMDSDPPIKDLDMCSSEKHVTGAHQLMRDASLGTIARMLFLTNEPHSVSWNFAFRKAGVKDRERFKNSLDAWVAADRVEFPTSQQRFVFQRSPHIPEGSREIMSWVPNQGVASPQAGKRTRSVSSSVEKRVAEHEEVEMIRRFTRNSDMFERASKETSLIVEGWERKPPSKRHVRSRTASKASGKK
jgi:hypothetical protein